MKVVILGNGIMLANLILGARAAGADIVGVFRYDYTKEHYGLKMLIKDFFKPAPEVTVINEFKLHQIRMSSANSEIFQKLLISLNPDLMIVGTWGEKICSKTYNIPKIATVNVHPSLLPKYRGPNPYMQTILHGETYSGVTIHLMNDNFDSGAILKQEKIRIFDTDTSKELKERTVRAARDLITELITDLNKKILMPINQDERYASYFPNITGDEKMLDFSIQTSLEISRTIRALHPFLPCYITYEDKFFIVDPYSFKILGKTTKKPNSIIEKDSETLSLTIVCADGVSVRFSNLKLYKSKKAKQYIKQKVKLS